MFFVYALWSKKFDKIYVGFSSKPNERLKDHNSGKSTYTNKFKPWQRFYLEEVSSKEEALKREKYYKSGWGRKKLKFELENWQSGRMRQS
ncbi:MAG: GIY-YIG nuclease family protein [Flavobacteriaceae bacterium]|nr:GIY-YIG nuclease family protein [Flavobacteriaceae bacterium]